MNTTRTETVLPGGAVMTTLHGERPGPTLALLGGVHGDEDEGVLAVRLLVRALSEAPVAGTVRAVAPANPLAWAAVSRNGPLDDRNLARSFPGDDHGTPTQALAAGITHGAIDGADLLIDLHSAGSRYRMPLFCGFIRRGDGSDRSERAAAAFGAPLIWAHPQASPGRSLSVAIARGIPAIYAECSGGGSIRWRELDAYVRGVQAVMAEFGMLPSSYRIRDLVTPRWVFGGGDLDSGVVSRHDGFFVSTTGAGMEVRGGDDIGRIYSFAGELLEIVAAPAAGMVMFLRREARTRSGDVLLALARLDADSE